MDMSPDSIYFLYTDGLFECLNYEGMELGMSGFTSFLSKFRDKMNRIILPFMIKQLLIEENYDLKGDDFTLLTLQKFDDLSMQDRILLRYTSKNRKSISMKAEAFIMEKFDDHDFYLTINSVIANYFHNIVDKHSVRKVDNSILLQMKIDADLELTFWEKFDSNKSTYRIDGDEGLHKKDYIMDSNFNKYPLWQNRYDEIVETLVKIPIK